jgi:hypothetical protein
LLLSPTESGQVFGLWELYCDQLYERSDFASLFCSSRFAAFSLCLVAIIRVTNSYGARMGSK